MIYGRFAEITDPFGAEFSVIARPDLMATTQAPLTPDETRRHAGGCCSARRPPSRWAPG